MARLVIFILLFLLSLLCVVPAPAYYLWYVAILVSEFSVLFIVATVLLLLWKYRNGRFSMAGNVLGVLSLILYIYPLYSAHSVAETLDDRISKAFGNVRSGAAGYEGTGFVFGKLLDGVIAHDQKELYQTLNYSKDSGVVLSLDYYPAQAAGRRPCVVVVHGGSWSAGDSRQLPELNNVLAAQGYQVVSINYRLAPGYLYPAPQQDLSKALKYLRHRSAAMEIDTTNFILLGRSAGGQIVLSAAYGMHEPGVRGVIDFYGPTDIVWGYEHPANPLVLNTCKVMEVYLGGSLKTAGANYLASSAILAADSASVPTLMIYGKNDALVAYEHGVRLDEKLSQLKVPHLLLSLPWATHGCDYSLYGPSGQLCTYTILQFLRRITANTGSVVTNRSAYGK